VNYGLNAETFNVAIYADSTPVDTIMNVALESGESIDLNCTWNTTGFSKGYTSLVACVTPVEGETHISDNNMTASIFVTVIGDITGPEGNPDSKCDMRDVGLVAKAFGAELDSRPHIYYYWHTPRCAQCPHSMLCDLTGPIEGEPDGLIDMRDIGLVARHFGEMDP
jgi:hypothetical protein